MSETVGRKGKLTLCKQLLKLLRLRTCYDKNEV